MTGNDNPARSTFGGKLADRLADATIRAIIDTRGRLAPDVHKMAVDVFTTATNHISDEVRSAGGQIFRQLARDPKLDDNLRPLLTHLGGTRGQAYGWIGGAIFGTAAGAGLMDVFTNWMSEPIGAMIAQNPRFYLSPEQVAQLRARGITPGFDAYYESAAKGLNADRQDALMRLAQNGLPPDAILQLLNRGHLDKNSAYTALRRIGMDPDYIDLQIDLAQQFLTPEQSAAGWARNSRTKEQVYDNAKLWGLSQAAADVLMDLAGEPPPLDAVISAWRRGIMTEGDVDRAIIQGPIRNEWIPAVKALQFQALPPEQAAISVTQGHLAFEDAMAKAALSGITEEDFRIIVDNAGLPPGIEFAAEAVARGVIDLPTWRSMFLESRIKNKWIPVMEAMLTTPIPADTARMAYRLGAYPAEALIATLKAHRFSDVDARAMVALEDARKHESSKDLTRAQLISLYEDEIIPREQLEQMLTSIGYDHQEVTWQVGLADINKVRKFVNALVTKVHNGFLAANIDQDEAMQLLTDAGVGTQARDQYMTLWQLEQDALSANLTTAQIQAAIKRGYLTDAEAADRFERRGYRPADAQILVKLAHPAGP